MKWLGITFMAALLATAPAYGGAQQPKDQPSAPQSQGPAVKAEAAGTAKSFTPAARQAYEKKTAKELAAIQQKIADLRVQATTGSPQMKRIIIRAANHLQMQKTAAGNRLTALGKAAGTAWSQQKADLDKAMAQLRKACEADMNYLK
jgi:hypothetical protein